MSFEHQTQIRVTVLNHHRSIHPSDCLDVSRKENPDKIFRQNSLPEKSSFPIHFVTRETNERCRSQCTIHTHLGRSNRLFGVKQNDTTGITNGKKPLKLQNRNASTVTKVSSRQSKKKKNRILSMPLPTMQITNESSSSTFTNFNNKNNKLSPLSNNQTMPINEVNDNSKIVPKQTSTELNFFKNMNRINENKTKKEVLQHQRHFNCIFCRCSLIRIVIAIIATIIILSAFAAVIVALYGIGGTTATHANTTSSTTTSTTATTSTTSTTSTTTSTTTTSLVCGSSCLNQSWISSAGIVALWSFENSFEDSTNVYNATPSSQTPSFVLGYVGQAASFNATQKQALRTASIPFNNVSFTVDLWMKQNGYPNPSDYSIVGLCSSGITDSCLHMNIRNTKFYMGFYFNDIQSVTSMPLNLWTHAAFVFDVSNRQQSIYVNGVLNQQRTASSALKNAIGNFTVGTNEHVRTPNNYFQGYLDQLSINRRAKSSCEILDTATLAGYFKFDVDSCLVDSGPNGVMTKASNYLIISGHKNQAISFSGAPMSYFQASGFTGLGMSNRSFSITFRIQPQILSGTLVHLSTSSLGTGSQCFPLLGFASNGAIVAQILTKNSTVAAVTGPILPLSSTWIEIVQTWSSTNGLKLYVNNTLVSSVAVSTFLGSETTPNYLTLGNCLNGRDACVNGSIDAPGPFTGAIDDWRIYNRELNSNDICTLYSS
ncbi:unnamed protein product [Rotaria magnacalcarata]|uniref:LamG-like jellyroll fold domain-containing protein n=3 Tax=Rotaria magnacalcarata TaxID=392030 RepID=A0A816UVX0_9BILA|nr:unnamed protein product [Rotaria magnacalcarata]